MVDPDVLRRFSAGASRYDAHAHAQRLSAVDLLAYTEASLGPAPDKGLARPMNILEPGCGTGLYTRMLLDAFPAASILGIDVSEAMIRVARKRIDDQGWSSAATGRDAPGLVVEAGDPRARFAVADAEEIATGSYDLVTSNAVFQWFLSLPRTLARMASLLPGGGLLTFSFFGPETYAELADALRAAADGQGRPSAAAGRDAPGFIAAADGQGRPGAAAGRDAPGFIAAADGQGRPSAAAGRDAPGFIAAAAFHSREEISGALSAAFPRWDVVERRYHQEFPTLAALLQSIRYTGTRGGGARESWSPGKLARVEEAYRERDGGIRATYQVFLCRGVIPGEGTG
jgi:SAM-dependent methyltransferase